MKSIALYSIAILFIALNNVFAQNGTSADTTKVNSFPPPPPPFTMNDVFEKVETAATFPGGNYEMELFINRILIYPEAARENNEHGRVYVGCIVEMDGSISLITVSRGFSSSLNAEAMRIVRAMPKWNPAKNGENAVRSWVVIPILFVL